MARNKMQTNGATVKIAFSPDAILIAPSPSLQETVGAILRASSITVNGTAVAVKAPATMAERRLGIAQVAAIREMSESARNAAFKAGVLTLPLVKRGRPMGARGVSLTAFFASNAPRAPRKPRQPRTVVPEASGDTPTA